MATKLTAIATLKYKLGGAADLSETAQLDDGGEFHDPWRDQSLHTQDLVIAAFVRIAGPERFDLSALDRPRAEMIGYEPAELDPASRSSLVAQCKAVDVSTYH